MVFEVLGTATRPQLVSGSDSDEDRDMTAAIETAAIGTAAIGTAAIGTAAIGTQLPASSVGQARSLPDGVIQQLLRSAVALQAEGLLRTAGALAGAWGGVLGRTERIERDARDLVALATAASAAKVPLPAGVDAGAGDPEHPGSVVEGLLAAQEALVTVLRQLALAGGDENSRPWLALINAILSHREEEMIFLRAVGAAGRLPSEEVYVRGNPPRR
jgi:hypothetical protein